MDRKRKFEMLSVVAFGIHTEVRRRVEAAIDHYAERPALGRQLRPFFFYEYFLDPPARLNSSVTNIVAFAPFMKRLVLERDFIAVPPNGFDKTQPKEFQEMVQRRSLLMLPTNAQTLSTHWTGFTRFQAPLEKSLVISLLYKGWKQCAPRSEYNHETGDIALDPEALTEADDREVFTQLDKSSLAYNQGTVSLATAFREDFARKKYVRDLDQIYALESQESVMREFSLCIYPWLLSVRSPGKTRRNGRLFEILACSISSRSIFFGELILIVPPLESLEARQHAYSTLRKILRNAVQELYVPMLTLYENYSAEKDLERILKAEHGNCDVINLSAESRAYLKEIGTVGRSSIFPPSQLLETSGNSKWEQTGNVFLNLLSHIPVDTTAVQERLSQIEELISGGSQVSTIELRNALANARACLEALIKRLETAQATTNQDAVSPDYQPPEWLQPLCSKVRDTISGIALYEEQVNQPGGFSVNDSEDFRKLRLSFITFDKGYGSLLSEMERCLVELWAHRLACLPDCSPQVLKSLVFANYLIASPGMVKCILNAMATRHTRKEATVRTTLVIGEAGSGKDSMARLVHLFAPGYRFEEPAVLNLAMLRPKEIAVPFLLGLDAQITRPAAESDEVGGPVDMTRAPRNIGYALKGLFQQALGSVTKRTPLGNTSQEPGFTFIFDELNSLDIDTQGALLRVLENAELRSLGSLESQHLDFLVVGVMNEDPHLIMKKRTLDSVLKDKEIFGGILGESLYEIVRTQRRLRDDLYYRLARGGEIRVPELRKRREDIPILVYFIVLRDLVALMPKEVRTEWEIELPVYEYLMNPSLLWEGNVRELQAVAKRLVETAVEEYRQTAPSEPKLVIRRSHAIHALEKSTTHL